MMGAGAIAAVSVVGAGLVDYPMAGAAEQTPAAAELPVVSAVGAERPVRYVRLKPGQKAPKGAKVVREPTPTPRVVVRRVVDPVPVTSARTVARSRQSGG